jgi:arsenate reductase
MARTRVLFVCTHNSARSQMAEGLLRAGYGDGVEALSAGTHPSSVHPLAIEALAELDIDISEQRSQSVDEFADLDLDTVVTVCDRARETCPVPPRARRMIHRPFEDPAAATGSPAERFAAFRRIRDEIRAWIDTEEWRS